MPGYDAIRAVSMVLYIYIAKLAMLCEGEDMTLPAKQAGQFMNRHQQ